MVNNGVPFHTRSPCPLSGLTPVGGAATGGDVYAAGERGGCGAVSREVPALGGQAGGGRIHGHAFRSSRSHPARGPSAAGGGCGGGGGGNDNRD